MPGRGFFDRWNSLEWALARRACRFNDTTILNEAISMCPAEDLDSFYSLVRSKAIENNATAILYNLVERDISIIPRFPAEAVGATKETLELLLAHGWDINARAETPDEAEPFMWFVAGNEDMIKWCLEHGASVHPRGQEPLSDDVITISQQMCEQILERVAMLGTVATFELLRSKGAPLGWRPLHLAVKAATHASPSPEGNNERMAMVLHLLDVVGIDVNALDHPRGSKSLPTRLGTPICYIPGARVPEIDTKDLTWLLLDRGADPTPAFEWAEIYHPEFIEHVKAWKKRQGSSSTCCLQ